jgi:hypothetical protein
MSVRTVAAIGLTVLAASFAVQGASLLEQMGPQVFTEPSVESAGGDDPKIVTAVESAVAVARKYQFRYDASESPKGRVVVTALWKGRPITLTMRFFWKNEKLSVASMLSQPGDLSLKKRGEKIEALYYPELSAETTRRGLQLYGDPDERP